jgi:hypothetical protein
MLIGVDFDNTIVSYDALFHRLALEEELVSDDVPATKELVRDHLRATGREDDWTRLQGIAYGPRLAGAAAFPGAVEFFAAAREAGIRTAIVSHKTRHPYRGERHDLHAAARAWIEAAGLEAGEVHLELTKDAKLERIGRIGATHFVDDLPEFLAEPAFPEGVERILFDPNGSEAAASSGFPRASSWAELTRMLLPAR